MTSNQQIPIAQIDLNSVFNYMFIMVFVVMMFRMMDKALEEPEERPKLPPVKAPPGYVPVGTPRKAPARVTEEEELRERKLALENKGREMAKEAGIEFLRLEEGWQSKYVTPRYWFKNSKGHEIIATDLDELKWKLSLLPQTTERQGIGLYRVNLAAPKHIEEVILENGTAFLKRYHKPVCRFKPTEEQRRRIKKGEGSLVIFDWQEIEWLGTSYWPETKGKVVFIGSCKVSEGVCLTHGYSVSKTVRCPKSPLTDEEWTAAWELAETAFPEGMSNPWVNGWWPETLEEAEKAVRHYSDALWDAYRKYEFSQRRAIENYARSRDKAIYYYRWYVMQEYERGKELAKKPREKALVGSPAVIPAEKRPRREGDLEYLADSPEFLTQTIEAIGYRDKLDSTFQEAIARAKGLR
jgi:hypothetical protein